MKHCIIVTGNIASGKSTFTKLLAKELFLYKRVCLDDERIDHWLRMPMMQDMRREELAIRSTEKKLLASNLIIFESSGVSNAAKRIITTAIKRKYELTYIHIDCPVDTCLQRYWARKDNGVLDVPLPYKKREIREALYDFAARQEGLRSHFQLRSHVMTPEQMIKTTLLQLNAKEHASLTLNS